MNANPILNILPLGSQWPTLDPFLFCVYHNDAYPAANADMGPIATLAGRNIGQDFSRKDGWSMYHGSTVPGFPAHPHRGFETVTVVRKGLIDHSDSLGATARFGCGDVQWLTAGKGIVHAEMFPLLNTAGPNPLELFQIWLNLPALSKMAEPHFTMFWADDIPNCVVEHSNGKKTFVSVIAGQLADAGKPATPLRSLTPPPDSWAAKAQSDVAIWTLRMQPGARFALPAAKPGTRRNLYFFKGASVSVGGQNVQDHSAIELQGDIEVDFINSADGHQEAEFLLLQGQPIGEPVAQYGPFVMNTEAEIRQAVTDYQRTQFGGWPFASRDPTHGRDPARLARYPGAQVPAVQLT